MVVGLGLGFDNIWARIEVMPQWKCPWTKIHVIVSLDKSLLGQKSPWTKVFLGQMSPWTNVSLDNSVLGLLSLGQTVTWTTVPWTNVSTPIDFYIWMTEILNKHIVLILSAKEKKFIQLDVIPQKWISFDAICPRPFLFCNHFSLPVNCFARACMS